ncbi:MAG TPA: TIGR00730 family Rossman fold protein [Planctomycetaceae bacterium]|nr:TIGR00730 family Rossman fold protein [Planctomycetaceae bacterium]HCD03159.1 TIGR00730 family Rossman fold protein [Planctomycetaceae bacterium]
MVRVCVFCGSKTGSDSEYAQTAQRLGQEIASRGVGLVYGGGGIGLMGVVADSVLESGGEVIGVIPDGLAVEEVMHQHVADMRIVADMHQRKAQMHELSDAYIALPGGVGTFEELFEVLAWRQLKIHAKPIGVLDIRGFFGPFLETIECSVSEGFMNPRNRQLFVTETDPAVLLDQLLEMVATV